MTYDLQIDQAVRAAAAAGLTTGDILFPLFNLAASTLANTVVHNGLDPEEELEAVRHQLDRLFASYLHAYRRQPA